MAASRIKGISIEIDGSTTKLQAALKDVNSKIKTTQDALKDVDKLLKLDPKNVELLRQKQQLLSSAIQETGEKLKIERQALEQLKAGPQTEETIRQQDALAREIIDTENNLKNLTAEYQNFGKEAGEQVKSVSQKMQETGEKIQNLGSGLSSAGAKLTKGVTLPLVGIGAAATAAFREVDDAMDIVVAKTGATGESLDDMQKRARNIAKTIPTSFQTAAEAIGEVNTRFGLTGDGLEDLSGKFVEFSTLNNTDVSSSVDVVQSALAAFGLEAKDAGAMLDTLNAAGQATGVSVDKIAEMMTTNAGALKEMGYSASDAAFLLGNLSKNGLDSSSVMTGLKKAYAESIKEGTSLSDTLIDLESRLQNSDTQAQAASEAIELFGTKSGGQLVSALEEGRLSFQTFGTDLGDFAGNVTSTFDTTLDPVDRLSTMLNTLKDTGAQLVETAGPMLNDMLGWLSETVNSLSEKWNSLSESQQQTVLKIAGVVAIAGPALSILGKATSGIGSLVSAGGGLISKLGSLGGGAKTAAESVGNLAGAAGGAAEPVSSAGGAIGKLSQNALGLVAAGAGILLAATGMALLAQSAIALANAGGPAIAVMGGLIVAVAGMAVGAAALAPALTAGAVGLVAFGGAITLIGVGILAATSGVALLATQLPNIATYGGTAAIALAMIGSTLTLVGAGAMVAAGGISTMLLPFAGAAVTIGATDLALVGLIATLGLSTAAGGLLAVALAAISAETKSIATDATTAGAALIAMTTSVNVISAAMDGFKALIKDAADWFVGIFERSKPTATKAAEQMAESAMQGMSRKMTDGTGAMSQKWTSALAEIEKRSSDSFGKIKNGISTDMGDMTKSVRQNLDEIQRSFDGVKFELGKNIKLPHFALNGKFDPESGKVPTVSVKWYRKAYDDAYILNGATIFGAMNGQYLGGGEGHGSELVVGTDKLMRMIAEASRGGGVTQNLTINAPQRLSAHEVARQTRLANRQLVLSLGGR